MGAIKVSAVAGLLALLLSGCSSSSTSAVPTAAPKGTPTAAAVPAVAEMPLADNAQAKSAGSLVYALSMGGNATAQKYVSPYVGFGYNRVMEVLKGCRVTTSWYGSGSMISADVTCRDGDIMEVDVTFDSTGKVTKMIGQGAYREFDSSVVGR